MEQLPENFNLLGDPAVETSPISAGSAAEHAMHVVEDTPDIKSPVALGAAMSDLDKTGLEKPQLLEAVRVLKEKGIPFDEDNIRRGLLMRSAKTIRIARQRRHSAMVNRLGIAPLRPWPDAPSPKEQHYGR